ncbi:MAG: hypothetical protein KY464_14875, partial [Gemmatimonadetes bacterium]|nr:hypothetical protein [Gemmatimonadota bacterium]
ALLAAAFLGERLGLLGWVGTAVSFCGVALISLGEGGTLGIDPGALPILLDEGMISPVDIVEAIRLDLADGVVMKPARSAGLMPSKRQWEIAQDAGMMILGSGLTDPDMSLAATLALFGAFKYTLPAALNGPQFVDATVLKTPLNPGPDATLAVPTGPGLGIEVDEAKLRALAAPA